MPLLHSSSGPPALTQSTFGVWDSCRVVQCDPGFTVTPSGLYCNDIDECLASPCNGSACFNFPGSYTCGCPPGYEGLSV